MATQGPYKRSSSPPQVVEPKKRIRLVNNLLGYLGVNAAKRDTDDEDKMNETTTDNSLMLNTTASMLNFNTFRSEKLGNRNVSDITALKLYHESLKRQNNERYNQLLGETVTFNDDASISMTDQTLATFQDDSNNTVVQHFIRGQKRPFQESRDSSMIIGQRSVPNLRMQLPRIDPRDRSNLINLKRKMKIDAYYKRKMNYLNYYNQNNSANSSMISANTSFQPLDRTTELKSTKLKSPERHKDKKQKKTVITNRAGVFSGAFMYDLDEKDEDSTESKNSTIAYKPINIKVNSEHDKYGPKLLLPGMESILNGVKKPLMKTAPSQSHFDIKKLPSTEPAKSDIVGPSSSFSFLNNKPAASTEAPSASSSSAPQNGSTNPPATGFSFSKQDEPKPSDFKLTIPTENQKLNTTTDKKEVSFNFASTNSALNPPTAFNFASKTQPVTEKPKPLIPLPNTDITTEAPKPSFSFSNSNESLPSFSLAKDDKSSLPGFSFSAAKKDEVPKLTGFSFSAAKADETPKASGFSFSSEPKNEAPQLSGFSFSSEKKDETAMKPAFSFSKTDASQAQQNSSFLKPAAEEPKKLPAFSFGKRDETPSFASSNEKKTDAPLPAFSFSTEKKDEPAKLPAFVFGKKDDTASLPAFSFTGAKETQTTIPAATLAVSAEKPLFQFGASKPSFSFGQTQAKESTKEEDLKEEGDRKRKVPSRSTFNFESQETKNVESPQPKSTFSFGNGKAAGFSFNGQSTTPSVSSDAGTIPPAKPFSFGMQNSLAVAPASVFGAVGTTAPSSKESTPLLANNEGLKSTGFNFGASNANTKPMFGLNAPGSTTSFGSSGRSTPQNLSTPGQSAFGSNLPNQPKIGFGQQQQQQQPLTAPTFNPSRSVTPGGFNFTGSTAPMDPSSVFGQHGGQQQQNGFGGFGNGGQPSQPGNMFGVSGSNSNMFGSQQQQQPNIFANGSPLPQMSGTPGPRKIARMRPRSHR